MITIMRRKIENALFELGITPNLAGFDYIRLAVEIIQNSKEKMKLVGGLYVDVAKEFKTTNIRVERAIRHAFSKMDIESAAFIKYFNTDKLTNYALLYTLAYILREDNTDESGD